MGCTRLASSSKSQMNSRPEPSRVKLRPSLVKMVTRGPNSVRRTGSVINVASVAGLAATPLMSHYGAAKAAVLSLTRSAAVEWAYAGVRVNALVPGWVETDLTDFARANEAIEQGLIARVPMQRWATVDEMAGPAVFLASDASSFMTGQTLIVDGGLSVT